MMKIYLSIAFSILLYSGCASATPQKSSDEIRKQAHAAYSELEPEKKTSPVADNATSPSKATYQNKNLIAKETTNIENKPVLMVMPEGKNPLEIVEKNASANAIVAAANEYLTAKGYEVKSLAYSQELDEIMQMQNEISETDDPSYLLGMAFGADVYIKFSGSINTHNTVFMTLNAYESSTGRMLGTQSDSVSNKSYSSANRNLFVQEALKKTMPGLERKILSYWAADIKKGVQYKIVMKIDERFTGDELEDLQDGVISSLRENVGQIRVNNTTDKIIDLSIYVNAKELPDAFSVYSAIRKSVSSLATARKDNIFNKVVYLRLE